MSFMAVKKCKTKKKKQKTFWSVIYSVLKTVHLQKVKEDANFFNRYVKLGTSFYLFRRLNFERKEQMSKPKP